MRVIAGHAGGLRLNVPSGVTRPTTDRVREALFSSLGDRVIDADVLDLYAGSGALGIEALSRGARSATFVDENSEACATIRENLRRTRLVPDADHRQIRQTSVQKYLQHWRPESDGRFQIVFADPPYARDADTTRELTGLLASDSLVALLEPDGLFLLETSDETPLPQALPPKWESLRDRRYGGTRLHYLTPAE